MRLRFLFIVLFIVFIGAIAWGVYTSKTNPLDYLFEIGVVLMGLGISILWQMKLFFLKLEHKKSFRNWLKKPNKKFVTLLMRDEQQQFPFIVPLNYLAKACGICSVFILMAALARGSFEQISESSVRLIVLGVVFSGMYIFWSLIASESSFNRNIIDKKNLSEWKRNPNFILALEKNQLAAMYFIFDNFAAALLISGIFCFFFGVLFSVLLKGV